MLQQRQAVQIDVVLLHLIKDRSAGEFCGGAQIARPALVFGMNAGRIEREGDPASVFHDPQTRYVAEFFGAHNILQALAEQSRIVRVPLA